MESQARSGVGARGGRARAREGAAWVGSSPPPAPAPGRLLGRAPRLAPPPPTPYAPRSSQSFRSREPARRAVPGVGFTGQS